jgi:WD40 repeat protein
MEQNGKRLRRWEFDGDIRAWDITTGQLRRTYRHQPPRNVISMLPSPDGTRFITFEEVPGIYQGAPKRTASLWDVATGQPQPLADGSQTYGPFFPDGRTLVVRVLDKDDYATGMKALDLTTGKEKWSIPVKEKYAWINGAAFSPDGRLLVGNYQVFPARRVWDKCQSWLKFWDTADGHEIASFAGGKNESFGLALFSPDGRTLAVTNWSRALEKATLFLYDVGKRRPMRTVSLGQKGQGERLLSGAPSFSPDGKWIAVVTQVQPDTRDPNRDVHDVAQPRIHLIDAATGDIRETLVAPQCFGRDVCFSPDGKTLATSGHGRVLLWDVSDLTGSAARAERR